MRDAVVELGKRYCQDALQSQNAYRYQQTRIENLQAEIADLEKELETNRKYYTIKLDIHVTDLVEKIEKLEDTNRRLNIQLSAARRANSTRIDEIATLKEKLAELDDARIRDNIDGDWQKTCQE